MIDRSAGIGGYILTPRPLKPGSPIFGAQLLAALEREDIRRFVERRPVLIPITPAQWQEADFTSLATLRTVFLIKDSTPVNGDSLAFFRTLKSAGLHVGLTGADYFGHDWDNLVPDFLLSDFRSASLPVLEGQIKGLRQAHPSVMLVAEGINSWSEHRLTQAMGFSFSVGDFAKTPDDERQAEPLSGSRLVILELLNKLRADVAPAQVVATAKHDPAIVLKLLKMANSPIYGLGRQITSLEDAVMILGRETLYRWLAIALFKLGKNTELDQTLLVLALGRGRFLEALFKDADKPVREEFFLLGLLSIVDKLLGIPMSQLVAQMTLPGEVAAALLNMEGAYARFLLLAIEMERCRLDQAVILASALNIPPVRLIECYSEALAWATSELLDSQD